MSHGYTDAVIERFWAKVDASGDCWVWTGADNGKKKPYGCFWPTATGPSKGKVYVHRFSMMLVLDGPIPDGLHTDHRCGNTLCVNPAHLDLVTNRENLMRAFIGDRNREHIRRRTEERRTEARRARRISAAMLSGDPAAASALAEVSS